MIRDWIYKAYPPSTHIFNNFVVWRASSFFTLANVLGQSDNQK